MKFNGGSNCGVSTDSDHRPEASGPLGPALGLLEK